MGSQNFCGYLLVYGDPLGGFVFLASPEGKLWEDYESAANFAEANIKEESWWVFAIYPATN